jgi:cyclophilin family peptidyl-prolyl cis-trans isomerase
MKKIVAIVFLFGLIAGCTTVEEYQPKYNIVEVSTEFGEMYFHLYNQTPLHQENFLTLVTSGFYNETEFHRIIPSFVIQGGDPNSKDDDRSNDGSGGTGYTIPAEIDSATFKHDFGAIGAARIGNTTNPERNSSGCQFYVVTDPDGTHFLDGEYTVFGEVLKGMDVALTIQDQARNAQDLPNDRIPMTMKVLIQTKEEFAAQGIIIPE